ncbi:hypothetical protein B0H14DRAFT_2642695 [Mycena olivaceomarginata]|nr:hypothetical protein B0H14DRAFT_2642695 [Mycena olivaceomarginata]
MSGLCVGHSLAGDPRSDRGRVVSTVSAQKLYRGIGENKMEKDPVAYSSTPRSQPKRSARGVLARSLMSIWVVRMCKDVSLDDSGSGHIAARYFLSTISDIPSAGHPRSNRGQVMVIFWKLFAPTRGYSGVCFDLYGCRTDDAASHMLLRFCGVPKFKAGNTDVAGIPVNSNRGQVISICRGRDDEKGASATQPLALSPD